MENCKPLYECLACGSRRLIQTLNLGSQPLANNFKSSANSNEDSYPLVVNRCEDCNHLQLDHIVDPRLIYTHYLYVSGTSGTYLEYMDWYARFVVEQFQDYPATVLDIGCNDGSQLNAFKSLGLTTFGVDPAENLYSKSSANHTVVCGFWDAESAQKLPVSKFDIITTQNAFAHIPDPLSYLKLAGEFLNDGGSIFISTSQADMVTNGEFDTIYHEHISYYNAESMNRLANRAGLFLSDVIKTPIHGTSYIFVLSKKQRNSNRMKNTFDMEQRLHQESTYCTWTKGVNALLTKLNDQLAHYRKNGYAIIGYGAAAKGMTLINASGIVLDAVIDDNPLKQGLFCPGTQIPVVSKDWLHKVDSSKPIVFVPLAWNFYTEIKRKILVTRQQPGDLFLRYFPEIAIECQ